MKRTVVILTFYAFFVYLYLQINKDIMLHQTTLNYFKDKEQVIESLLIETEEKMNQQFSIHDMIDYVEHDSDIEYEYPS